MSTIELFEIAIPEQAITDLHARIDHTLWPDALEDVGWTYGTEPIYLRSLLDDWRNRYDWRAQEKGLNALPQYRTAIDGLGLHFIHRPGTGPAPLPLVLTHGWPGSVVEFLKVIDPLVNPAAHGGNAVDAFHVVCPTLPGFGFSGKPRQPGWGVDKIGAEWCKATRDAEHAKMKEHGLEIVSLSDAESKQFVDLTEEKLWANILDRAPDNGARLKALFDKAA